MSDRLAFRKPRFPGCGNGTACPDGGGHKMHCMGQPRLVIMVVGSLAALNIVRDQMTSAWAGRQMLIQEPWGNFDLLLTVPVADTLTRRSDR